LTFELWNRFSFTKADAFLGTWQLLEDGLVVKTGAFEVPSVKPLARGSFAVDFGGFAFRPGKEYLVDFAFLTKCDVPWAKKGWPVARDQILLRKGGVCNGEAYPPPKASRSDGYSGASRRLSERSTRSTAYGGAVWRPQPQLNAPPNYAPPNRGCDIPVAP